MRKHMTYALVVAVVLILAAAAGILPRRVQAAWLAEGNPICVATGDQESSIMVDDGDGGMIIVWIDERNGNRDIYAQRVDMLGNPLWADGGVPVCTVTGNQEDIAAVSDEAGGVIVTREDWRSGSYSDIYCQRLGPDGVRLWDTAG